MILLISFLVGADIYLHIWEYKERKRLHECWDDVFNSKLDGEKRWHDLCCHYLERITELQTENEILKRKKKNNKRSNNEPTRRIIKRKKVYSGTEILSKREDVGV